jgi:tetratricopeptide (TPR) repeat protein
MKVFFVLLLSLAVHLSADADQARAYYNEGLKLQAAKQYQAALVQYQLAIQAESRYMYSYKQIGTCKYYLGDKPGALAAYMEYAGVFSNDVPVQAFIARLKAEGVVPAAAPLGLASAEALPQPFHRGMVFSLGISENTYAMGDYNSDLAQSKADIQSSGGTMTDASITGGFEIGMNVGYAFTAGMKLGLDLDYLMASSQSSISLPYGTETMNFNFPLLWVGPEFDYAFFHNRYLRVRLQAGFAYIMMQGADSTDSAVYYGVSYSSVTTYSGNGFGFKGGPGLDIALNGSCSLDLDLGYRSANITTVHYNRRLTIGNTTYVGTGTVSRSAGVNESLDYSGIHSRLGFNYIF